MTGPAWECEVMEKDLRFAEGMLAAAAAAPAGSAALDARVEDARYTRRVTQELAAAFVAVTGRPFEGYAIAGSVVLFIEPDGRIARWRFEKRSGDAAFDDALAQTFERARLTPPPPPLRELYRTVGLGMHVKR